MADSSPSTAAAPVEPEAGQRQSSSSIDRASGEATALQTEHGTTSISSSVVAKIAGLAGLKIPGVQAMGKSMTRALGALRSKVPGGAPATTQGVSVEVGERQAAVDIDIVAYYGQSIVETAEAIRQNVIDRIEGMTGLEVVRGKERIVTDVDTRAAAVNWARLATLGVTFAGGTWTTAPP